MSFKDLYWVLYDSWYINDLANACKHSILFADDSNLFLNEKKTEHKINSELADISEWLKANKLTLKYEWNITDGIYYYAQRKWDKH